MKERVVREDLTIDGGRRLYLFRFESQPPEAGDGEGPKVSSVPADDAVAQESEDDE